MRDNAFDMIDPDGEWAWALVGGIVGGAIGAKLDDNPYRGAISGFAGGVVTTATFNPNAGFLISGAIASFPGGVAAEGAESIYDECDGDPNTNAEFTNDVRDELVFKTCTGAVFGELAKGMGSMVKAPVSGTVDAGASVTNWGGSS